MSLANRMMDRFRSRLARFVAKQRAVTGCAKTAMKRVATKIGMSSIGVYRAMNGYGPIQVKAHQYAALIMVSLGSSKIAARFRKPAKFKGAELAS